MEMIENFFRLHFELIDKLTIIAILSFGLIKGFNKELKQRKEQWRMEWEAEQKRKKEPLQVFHHLTQAEFEKWKAERDKQEP